MSPASAVSRSSASRRTDWPHTARCGPGLSRKEQLVSACLPDRATFKEVVAVREDISCYSGPGICEAHSLPRDAFIIAARDADCFTASTLHDLSRSDQQECRIILAVNRGAYLRLFGQAIPEGQTWYLPARFRSLCHSIVTVEGRCELSKLLRAARSVELLTAIASAIADGSLPEAIGDAVRREQEITRISAAHRIICDDWRLPLTVSEIARRCGMSRTNLSRGYRELYRTTIGEALTELRLNGARQLLARTDLHVATVGYRCGYTNNTSFTHAFARYFGATPSAMRRLDRGA